MDGIITANICFLPRDIVSVVIVVKSDRGGCILL